MISANAGLQAPCLRGGVGRDPLPRPQAPNRTAADEGKRVRRPLTGFSPRILWIDDDQDVLRFVERLLNNHGFLIDGATTAAIGLERARHRVYDVIGLDLVLPDIPGIQVLRTLRSRGVEIPVFVLTGYFADDALVSSAWRAGASECRAKPIRAQILRELIDGMLGDSARRRALDRGRSVAALLAWLDGKESAPLGQVAHPLCGQSMAQLQARLLTAVVEASITIPAFHACARAFVRTLATDASCETVIGDVLALLQRAAPVSPVHPQVALAVAKLEGLRTVATRLSEADLAKEAAMAPSHLGRQLYRDTGLGFRTWLRIGRVRAAVRELAATQEHIKQIATGTHWSSHSRLDRDFHGLLGISPTEFRRRLAGARTLMSLSRDAPGGGATD